MLFNDLIYFMLVWIITFVVTMMFFYVLTKNFPQFGLLNSLTSAIFGLTFAYLLGNYFFGVNVIIIPLIL